MNQKMTQLEKSCLNKTPLKGSPGTLASLLFSIVLFFFVVYPTIFLQDKGPWAPFSNRLCH